MNEKTWLADPRLPYSTRMVPADGDMIEEYIIPEQEKKVVLETLYPFDPVPELNETMFDLHEEKLFRVGDFRVVRESGMNMLVSPYYFSSGGSVIDWMPPYFKPGGFLSRKIRGSSESLMTFSHGPRAL